MNYIYTLTEFHVSSEEYSLLRKLFWDLFPKKLILTSKVVYALNISFPGTANNWLIISSGSSVEIPKADARSIPLFGTPTAQGLIAVPLWMMALWKLPAIHVCSSVINILINPGNKYLRIEVIISEDVR